MAFLSDFVVAFAEEALNRGILLRYLELKIGGVRALVASSVVFGLLHILDAHMDLVGIIQITLAGFAFGAAYLLTRRLWMSIGLHTGTLIAIDLFSRLTPKTSIGWGTANFLVVALALGLVVLAARSGSFVPSESAWSSQARQEVSPS